MFYLLLAIPSTVPIAPPTSSSHTYKPTPLIIHAVNIFIHGLGLTLGCLAALVVLLVGKVLLQVLLDGPVIRKVPEIGMSLLSLQNKSVQKNQRKK